MFQRRAREGANTEIRENKIPTILRQRRRVSTHASSKGRMKHASGGSPQTNQIATCSKTATAAPASPACPPGRVFEASGLRFWRWLRGHSAQCSRRLLDGDRYSGWSRTGPRARGRPGAGRSPLQGTDIAVPSKERHGLSSLSPLSSPRPIARSPRQTANTEIR